MRRMISVLGVAALAGATLAIAGLAGPAHAQCEFDGSVPGTPSQVIPVETPAATFYVDDRDYADADGDGVSGGIWLYEEANGTGGLQRGGDQWIVGQIPGQVPFIAPIVVYAPNPTGTPIPVVDPEGDGRRIVTIFPNGFGGGSWAQALGEHDPCTDLGPPDRIWF